MKKRHLYFYSLTIIILALVLSSCANKVNSKSTLEISNSYPTYTPEQIIDRADLIVKGKITSIDEGIMVNPENNKSLKDDTGRIVANEQIHTYVFEIDTVYKGNYAEDTIQVKTSNGYALSPDLILYGEDETTILESPLVRFDLEVGSDCILALKYSDLHLQIRNGYYVVGGKQGVFQIDQAELFAK